MALNILTLSFVRIRKIPHEMADDMQAKLFTTSPIPNGHHKVVKGL